MPTTDLNLLRAFAAVVETGSYTRAAARLQCPKSWVSRAVTGLEDELGVRLLHRTTRSIALSTAGSTLYERIKAPLEALGTSGAELNEQQGGAPTGTLRITATVDFGATLLAGIVVQFCERNPGVQVDMHLTNSVVDVVGEGFDVALRFASKQMPDSALYAKKLMAFDMGIFASSAYLAKAGTPLSVEDLQAHTWVKFRPSSDNLHFDANGTKITVQPKGPVICDDMMAVHALALAGVGLALLPEFVVEGDPLAQRPVRVLPELRMRSGHLWFVAPSTKYLPLKVTAFRNHLAEALARCPTRSDAPNIAAAQEAPAAPTSTSTSTPTPISIPIPIPIPIPTGKQTSPAKKAR